MRTVLFACVHNAGRSQMAAAFLRHLADPSRVRAISAGTRPADAVHPVVLEVMREVGIELVSERPKRLTAELAAGASLLVTLGCGEECPFVPGVPVEDWPLRDPAGADRSAVREIRDEIRARVERLIASEGWGLRGSNGAASLGRATPGARRAP